MRVKAAKSLVFSQSDGMIVACNFLTKSVFHCSQDVMSLLARMDDWKDFAQLCDIVPDLEADELRDAVDNLVSMSALVREGTDLAAREADFESSWSWGIPAALMHYSVQDNDFMSLEQAESLQIEKVEHSGKIALHQSNAIYARQVSLPNSLSNRPLLQTMAARRTVRKALAEPVSLQQLSDCLFAGLGITGETENCVGRLPLSMTPSGGARNPYEAYIIAKNVTGLEPGVYHYSAMEHSLGFVHGDIEDVSFTALTGGQEWADDKPCMILLCAHLERTMWKYVDANAYRVVLIEAGHIGQNIMLSATDHGLTACPTAALGHTAIKSLLGLTKITHAPVYALTLSVPDRSAPLTKYLQS
jgi:SagB-type dehydrogenase family enzyme